MPEAKRAALEALALDETTSDAHTALGFVLHFYDWDWQAAEREYRRALDLNSGDGLARGLFAALLGHLGRHDQAIAEAQRNVDLAGC